MYKTPGQKTYLFIYLFILFNKQYYYYLQILGR